MGTMNKIEVQIRYVDEPLFEIKFNFLSFELNIDLVNYLLSSYKVYTISGHEMYRGKSLNDCINYCNENELIILDK